MRAPAALPSPSLPGASCERHERPETANAVRRADSTFDARHLQGTTPEQRRIGLKRLKITEYCDRFRYFEALKPDPPLFGRGALEVARIECGIGASNCICCFRSLMSFATRTRQ